MIKKIICVGATGMLGKPVVAQLVSQGFEITALARHPEKSRKLFSSSVKPVAANLKDAKTIDAALQGQDAIYVSLSVPQTEGKNDWHSETDGMKILLESAKRNNIRRIVLLSSLVQRYQGMNNFNWWVFEVKNKSIEMVKSCGIPYTIFYPSTFMESFIGKYKQGKRVLIAGKSEMPMFYISGEDYGKQVAASLSLPESENYEYVIQGPEAMTQDEAAAVFVRHYKKEKLTVAKAPLGLLKFLGKFLPQVNYGAHIVEALNRYPEKFESEAAWRELGKPTITLQHFAENA